MERIPLKQPRDWRAEIEAATSLPALRKVLLDMLDAGVLVTPGALTASASVLRAASVPRAT